LAKGRRIASDIAELPELLLRVYELTRHLNLMLFVIGLAGAIFFIYLGWWFAAAVSATFWPT
jgi:hypothetical protein